MCVTSSRHVAQCDEDGPVLWSVVLTPAHAQPPQAARLHPQLCAAHVQRAPGAPGRALGGPRRFVLCCFQAVPPAVLASAVLLRFACDAVRRATTTASHAPRRISGAAWPVARRGSRSTVQLHPHLRSPTVALRQTTFARPGLAAAGTRAQHIPCA